MQAAWAILVAGASLLAVPAVVLGVECLLALLPLRRRPATSEGPRPSMAVIVPAHNEEGAVAQTVEAIRAQLGQRDRLVVVADNCTDQTAALAAEAGAVVWPRENAAERGKGFALRFALSRLAEQPPEVVAVIDADCLPGPGALDAIARAAAASGRPAQAAYYCSAVDQGLGLSAVSSLAVLVKNVVRPRGLQRIGLPCLLTGTGMAFPWTLLERVPFDGSHIVEDMQMSVDMALQGKPPAPCMDAAVYSTLPARREGFVSQRTRWEHGHLAVIRSQAPRLLGALLRTGRLSLLALLLELSVPPLSLFGLLYALAGGAIVAAAWAFGFVAPAAIVLGAGALAAVGLTAAWARFGRETLPARALVRIPVYILAKLPIYLRFLTGRQREWVRTQRDTPNTPRGPA